MDTGIYIRMIGAMAMVLGLMAVLFLCLKKWGNTVRNRGGGLIEVMETRMIMPRRHICIVRAGSRVMVLASSEKGLDYLGDMDADDRGAVPDTVSDMRGKESGQEQD